MSGEILPKVVELSADLLEPVVDALTDHALLKEIPVLGVAVKVAGIAQSVSNRIFLSKVRRFLITLEAAGAAEAQQFADRVSEEDAFARRTGEALLVTIDGLDDVEKAELLAMVFAAYLRATIQYTDFRLLSRAISAVTVVDLRALVAAGPDATYEGADEKLVELLDVLMPTGLTGPVKNFALFPGSITVPIAITPLGRLLISIIGREVSGTGSTSR